MRVDDGQVSLTRADRPKVLNENATTPAAFTSAPPQRFLEHRPWLYAQNFTAMIDFPTLAQTLGDLFPEMSGSEIDGVVYVDSTALAALVGLVGEVHLEDADRTIRADEVSGFITIDQYDIEFESLQDREDFLGELIGAIFDAMLGPETELKLENLRPVLDAIREDRLMFAPLDDSQLSAMKALGIAGGVERTVGHDYLAVSHLNGGPNKLDAYLHRSVDYRAEVDPETGDLHAVLDVTLRNDAPFGISEYAAGNEHGYPTGSNRVFVVVHTPHNAIEWSGGDEPELTRSWAEFELQRHEQVVVVPRGKTRTVSLRLHGSVAPGDYHLDIGHQPLVHNDALTIEVNPTAGTYGDPLAPSDDRDLRAEFVLSRDTKLDAPWTALGERLPARMIGGG